MSRNCQLFSCRLIILAFLVQLFSFLCAQAQTVATLAQTLQPFTRQNLIATGYAKGWQPRERASSVTTCAAPELFDSAHDTIAFSAKPTATPVPLKHSFSPQRLAFVSAMMAATNWIAYHQLNDAWWQEKRGKFHFYKGYRRTRGFYDLAPGDSYCYHLDKGGHFLSAIFFTESLTSIYQWVGFSESRAEMISALVASALLLEVEIYDGFFQDWGFSLGDFAANELGVLWVLAQRRVPALQAVRLKISYDPFAPVEDDSWIKSYNAMTFWASFPVRSWLPAAAQKIWPGWLNLAFGYGTDRLRHGRLETYLAFDVNGEALIKSRALHLLPLRLLLNYVRLPLPALQLKPSLRFSPLHF